VKTGYHAPKIGRRGRQVANFQLTLSELQGYLRLLEKIERAIAKGLIYLIADKLKTHKSAMVAKWLEEHPRIEHVFIPKGAAWLNLIEVW
jgi:hypothetical protein